MNKIRTNFYAVRNLVIMIVNPNSIIEPSPNSIYYKS